MVTGRLKLPTWIVPLIIAGLVALFGWWGNAQLRQVIVRQLRAELTSTLNANVTALEIWMANQKRLATALAEEPKLRSLAVQALEEFEQANGDSRKIAALPEIEELRSYLRPRLEKVGYQVAIVVNTNFHVVADSMRGRLRSGFAVSEELVAKFSELFTSGQPVIVTPFKPKPPPGPPRRGDRFPPGDGPPRESRNRPLTRPSGTFSPEGERDGVREARFRERGTNDFAGRPPPGDAGRFRRGDLMLMQVAAPVRDENGVVRGAFALMLNPDEGFSRILSVARSGESGETYAFDQRGLLISRSRFDDQLKKLGLLEDRSGASSALNLRLSDPGSDRPEKIAPEPAASATRPLTRIVDAAVDGGKGLDTQPSRDYRGVPVVGAWCWLPEHGFGVATQIDADDAYQPLRVLQRLFIALVLLLTLSAMGMLLFSYRNLVWRQRLNEAELKLKQLGQYTMEEKIGEGGKGVVYRARHALMRRDTAVKLLLPDRADPESIRRFEREVRLTCQLTHPNTIQVFDYGHTPEGIFYYAMEYLRGLNLHDLVARFGPQPEGRVIHILTQICDSLAEAHALGLVHRDIKPANVFLCDRGGVPDCVKVLDFGLVREYHGGERKAATDGDEKSVEGTPSFMPPEAIKDAARSDPRSDLYAVGALGYYLLTAKNVFDARSLPELYEKHLLESPTPPRQRTTNPIGAELEMALLRCLEKGPDQRPQSAGELRALLLANPHTGDWGQKERAAWWQGFHDEEKRHASDANGGKAVLADRTVRINLADRTG
jgi:hypothetical protein